jgi:hypothetical protein
MNRWNTNVLFLVIAVSLGALGATAFLLLRGEKPTSDDGDLPAARQGGFRDEAAESGITFRMSFRPAEEEETFKINLYDHGSGVAVGDFDGDGFEDVYFVNMLGRSVLYRNKGDGTFEDVTDKAGVGLGDRVCVAATFADYDNDGHLDLFVTSTRGGNVLFRNMGDGTFKDVTREAGLTCIAHSQTAVFFDFDNDGFLDLFVTNTARWTLDDYNKATHYFPGESDLFKMAGSRKETNRFFRNNGNGTFTDVTEKVGLQGKGWGGDVAVFDYNHDAYLDLLVTNMFGASQLYRNNGGRDFTDVTRETLGRTSFGAIGCKAFDFDNDGLLDLLIVDMHSDMWLLPNVPRSRVTKADLKKKYPKLMGLLHEIEPESANEWETKWNDLLRLRYDEVIFGNTLFKQLPGGRFEEVSDKANLETWWPWGIAVGDFDNDGYQDVFLPSGMGYPYEYWPNALMMNNGDGTFTDRAEKEGIEPPRNGIYLPASIRAGRASRSSRCAAVADFRGDGRLDIVVNNYLDHPYYFRNNFPKKHYIAFRLTGTKSNRDAIGALVTLHIGNEVMVRQVDPASGYLSHSSRTVHFGLGDRPRIDWAEIRWPSSRTQRLDVPAIDRLHPITEPN